MSLWPHLTYFCRNTRIHRNIVIGENDGDGLMTFYIQQIKGQRHSEIIMFCKTPFLVIVQQHNPEKEREILQCECV